MLYREQKYDFIRFLANYFLEQRVIEPIPVIGIITTRPDFPINRDRLSGSSHHHIIITCPDLPELAHWHIDILAH